MRLYSLSNDFILENNEGCRLYWSKQTGDLYFRDENEVFPLDAYDCGEFVTFLGKLTIEDAQYLLLATESTVVGNFQEKDGKQHPIQRINRVRAIPKSCDEKTVRSLLEVQRSAADKLKSGTEKLLKFMQERVGEQPSLLDEILRLFNDDPDFYFCFERDITLSTQKYYSNCKESEEKFFWNQVILAELMEIKGNEERKRKWIIPIVQGHVSSGALEVDEEVPARMGITLISRRSVHRAGARYLRRGIDQQSYVANFVESELLINIFEHSLSFVQIRGSVPLFWSQKGYKFRPPLTIEKPLEESFPYFEKHMWKVAEEYGTPVVAVNLVSQSGRELKLAESYIEHALKHDNPDLAFISFDLHHHCRGLNFDKIRYLIHSMEDLLREIGYCWVDKRGEIVQTQKGVVRTNCVDCLDRTNVVQGAISTFVCLRQAQKLGIYGPLNDPPEPLVQTLQRIWADNGDAISTQYAGTAALKGDVTRSGERKLAGIMKDGYNSASRYYLSHVRDTARQKAINRLLGQPDQGNESMIDTGDQSDDEEPENVSRLVSETIHFLIPEGETVIGGWGLINGAKTGSSFGAEISIDTVVLLTRTKLYVAAYNDDAEKLLDVVGLYSNRQHLRVTVRDPSSGLTQSFTWRPSRTRLFNNVALILKSLDEANEYIDSVGQQIAVAIEMYTDRAMPVFSVGRLEGGSVGAKSAAGMRKALASVIGKAKAVGKQKPEQDRNKLGMEAKEKDKEKEGKESSNTGILVDLEETLPTVNSEGIRDDLALNHAGRITEIGQQLRPSVSDGLITEKATLEVGQTSDQSNGVNPVQSTSFMGRLKGAVKGGGASNSTTQRRDPMEKYADDIKRSKTKIILL
ncbi:hypothetical protein WR25_20741 isoform A [Diploscapter pachys]|uniref:SAC domain-containing protein n=2 Tax=Diploscapter pachys TaxID=2018661 RepID=A0A2A2JU57_9BILA|nr:hypothetical protein WR25_20741 isoform A [Diploscapter pachys]